MHITTIFDLISEKERATCQLADRLREQIAQLTADLAQLDRELGDLAITRTTLRSIAAVESAADDPVIASAPYQQILVIMGTASTAMRPKDVCIALGIDPVPKHVEDARRKLKRMVACGVLTEDEPGMFALIPKRT